MPLQLWPAARLLDRRPDVDERAQDARLCFDLVEIGFAALDDHSPVDRPAFGVHSHGFVVHSLAGANFVAADGELLPVGQPERLELRQLAVTKPALPISPLSQCRSNPTIAVLATPPLCADQPNANTRASHFLVRSLVFDEKVRGSARKRPVQPIGAASRRGR